jgi:hypothetical protein
MPDVKDQKLKKLFLINEDGSTLEIDRDNANPDTHVFYNMKVVNKESKMFLDSKQHQVNGNSQKIDILRQAEQTRGLKLQMNENLGNVLISNNFVTYYDPYELDQYNESKSVSCKSYDSNDAENPNNSYPETPESSVAVSSNDSDSSEKVEFGQDEDEQKMKRLFDMMRQDEKKNRSNGDKLYKNSSSRYQGARMDGWYGEDGEDHDGGYYTNEV